VYINDTQVKERDRYEKYSVFCIEREYYCDGASAQYGSDAIAG
jgi:hypothetical protein